MNLRYTPLLGIQREIQGRPRNYDRFQHYLRTIMNAAGSDVELVPLLAMNPMGKDHVTELLDELLAMDADGIGVRAAAEASNELVGVSGDFRAAIVLVDDLLGGWTNRWSYEFGALFPAPGHNRFWVTGNLWVSEPASSQAIRETILKAAHRTAFVLEHGPPRTLRNLMKQEGEVMVRAGCITPKLEEDDLSYTREVIAPHLDASDTPTSIGCLFGDAAGRTLGFTPRGLSPWAGIAVALHDAKAEAAVLQTC